MKSAAPKFKGTMLMMNQGGGAPAFPPAPAPAPAAPSAGAAGAPSAGAVPGSPSRLKGTIVGVAPPNAGAAPAPPPGTAAFGAPPPFNAPPAFGAPPAGFDAPPQGEQHQFGSPQTANPLGATIAFDGSAPAYGVEAGGGALAYGAPPDASSFGAPPPDGSHAYGASPAGGMDAGGMGGGAYGVPPQGGGYGAVSQPGFGPPPGAPPGFDPVNAGMSAMQPYGAGAPMGAPGMVPGAMIAGQKSWMTTLLLAIFAGTFGVHRFYTGHTLLGALQLLTCGGLGIWTLVDIIFIATGKFTDAQGRPLAK